MKAFNKGKLVEPSRKKQQKKEDINHIANQLEIKIIAAQVGIAQQQIPSFKWFFDQLEKFKLPPNYERQLNDRRTQIIYKDKNTKNSSTSHPLLSIMKTFFYTQYKSNRSAFTFSNKQEKLLPYVQEKMMKNCFSLNSKRRQVENSNLQRDENGRMVLSKLARVKPDVKNLISGRNYMLKMLIDKVYTTKQIWGKGKRARAIARVINQKVKDQQQDIQSQLPLSTHDLQTYQSIYIQASRFYQTHFGDLLEIPQRLKQNQAYRDSTPQRILRCLYILDIEKNHIEFYWFARLMDCLPLPYNWSFKLSSGVETYFYEPLKIGFDIHPSYVYFLVQINNFMNYFSDLDDEKKAVYLQNKKMTFLDFFQRQYSVDMYGLLVKEELKKLSKSDGNQLVNQVDIKLSKQQNTNDWMIVQAIVNSQMKSEQYSLIGAFCEFWQSKEFSSQEWIPSVSPFGEVTWSDAVNYSSIDDCPYTQELTATLQIQRKRQPTFSLQDFKQDFRKDIQLTQDGQIRLNRDGIIANSLIADISVQRQRFIRHYIKSFSSLSYESYDIKDNDMQYYFDQIFLCPFDIGLKQNTHHKQNQNELLQKYQQEQVPFWIEKVRARKLLALIKNGIRANCVLEELREMVRQFVQDIAQRYESQTLGDMKGRLKDINDLKELQEFVEIVTDIDGMTKKDLENVQINEIDHAENRFDVKQNMPMLMLMENGEDSNVLVQQESQEGQQQQQEEKLNQQQLSQLKQQVNLSPLHNSIIAIAPQQHSPTTNKNQPEYSFIKQMKQQQLDSNHNYTCKKLAAIKQCDNDDQKLQLLVRKELKEKQKALKYKKSHLKSNVNYQKKVFNQLGSTNAHDKQSQSPSKTIRHNLIATSFKYSTVPEKDERIYKFKDNQTAAEYLKKKNSLSNIKKIDSVRNNTEFQSVNNSTLVERFQSEVDEMDDDGVDIIQQLEKKEQIGQKKEEQAIEEEIEITEEDMKQYQFTASPRKSLQQLIFLEPIKPTKPDIQYDPILKHIQSVNPFKEFDHLNSIFKNKSNKKQPQTPSPTKIKIRSRSSSSLIKAMQSTQNSLEKSDSFAKNSPVKIKKQTEHQSLKSSMKRDKILEEKLFPSIYQSFNRVCLGQTASSMVISQPIKRKGELLVLQARKDLLHKGRGLETYMSRKY